MNLGIPDFTYPDLHDPRRLADLSAEFRRRLAETDSALAARYDTYCEDFGSGLGPVEHSEILIAVAQQVGRFLEELFRLGESTTALRTWTQEQDPVFKFRKEVLKRVAKKYHTATDISPLTPSEQSRLRALIGTHGDEGDEEMQIARLGLAVISPSTSIDITDVSLFERWCALQWHHTRHVPPDEAWALWREPDTLDYERGLVESIPPANAVGGEIAGPEWRRRQREGFSLTDQRMDQRHVLAEVKYCILCHDRDKDSCSKGLLNKDSSVKSNPLGIALDGCPLDEKISEAHLLKGRGEVIAALAMVMLDNPMCPGTGHRICNDCMKSCIYQKQEPVNIPQIETGILSDVLRLPWGVEVYDLLTRWNPLNVRRPYRLPYNGHDVLVVGMGPAGYTLAHYLTNEGFGVVGIDGLKIESLPVEWTGQDSAPPAPIEKFSDICRSLDKRVLAGFGGVSEYGITVRWDKNYLTLLHLTLARRSHMRIYGGIRFGGTITIEDAIDRFGFSHIAIASGAGKPTVLTMKDGLMRGVRMASDFLMALQLTGSFKDDALANLQVRLPALVIGGGLTAIDTATELLAYYPVQVEKVLTRFESLVAANGEGSFWHGVTDGDRLVLEEFIDHARQIRSERENAKRENRPAKVAALIAKWGGCRIVYRKDLVDSPAYRLNHEEVIKSFEEGVTFVERLSPVEAIRGIQGSLDGVVFEKQTKVEGKWKAKGEMITLPAQTMLVAAGTSPNTIYEREFPGTFELDKWGQFFKPYKRAESSNGNVSFVPVEGSEDGFFTSYGRNGRRITFYGDNHPKYAGNVVKAMASAKHGYPEIVALLDAESSPVNVCLLEDRPRHWRELVAQLDNDFLARVERVERLTPTIVEVVVRAPLAARRFHPGQFYRLQNFERHAPRVNGTTLAMEGLALTGAWVDRVKGLLSLIVLEMGVSSRLCAFLKPGEPVIVMGPTGSPTEMPERQTVLLAGGGLGNAVLFSIADELKVRNNHVIYFAGYKRATDVFKREEVESGTDVVVWSTDQPPAIQTHRAQDRSFVGNIVQAMNAYGRGEMGPPTMPFSHVNRIIAIGSDRMMNAVREARHGVLADLLPTGHVAIGSINSTMQCMMKEICAQCLQMHVDPVTGEPTGAVFSCFNQDQPLDQVDFKNLNERLKANSAVEHVSNLWLDHLLATSTLPHV